MGENLPSKNKKKKRLKITLRRVLDVLNIVVLIISLATNVYLAIVNNSISQQSLELQKTLNNYAPFVTGFQQDMTLIKFETHRGTMKAKVVVISPHTGYYNITLANYTFIEKSLDMNQENQVGLEQEVRFHATAAGANSFDENLNLWTTLFPSLDYLPPKAPAARIPVARLVLELVYQDTVAENTTKSQFPGFLWLSINEPDV